MELLKQLLTYAVLIGLLIAGSIWIPRLTSRVQVPPDYSEIVVPDIEHYPSYAYEKLLSVDGLKAGDTVCYQVPNSEGVASNGFAWVAAVPGDEVRLAKGQLMVNGKASTTSGMAMDRPDIGPLIIPANHVYVVTTTHRTDSLVRGPMPLGNLRGRVENFP
jgi:hypothetical protein